MLSSRRRASLLPLNLIKFINISLFFARTPLLIIFVVIFKVIFFIFILNNNINYYLST